MATALDIVLPCYNPPSGWEDNIINSYQNIKAAIRSEVTIILVNDGSESLAYSSIQKLRQCLPKLTLVTYPGNKGKGYALRKGVEVSQSPVCIYTDIDFPYQEHSIKEIYEALHLGETDIAAGVRSKTYYDTVPSGRRLLSKAFKKTISLLFKLPITDTQCGLKGFNTKGKKIFLHTTINRYLFDLEFIHLASKAQGIKIKKYSVDLKEGIIFRKMNTYILIREGVSFLKIVFQHLFC